MKRALMTPLAAIISLIVAAGISTAQVPSPTEEGQPNNAAPGDAKEKPEMGASGWLGGRKDPTPQAETTGAGPNAGHVETPGNINNDTFYATGSDLKGQPTQFPADQTPE